MRGWRAFNPENITAVLRKPKPAPPLESAIQKAILDYLRFRGHLGVRFNNIPVTTPEGRKIPVRQPGVSDILGCQKGTGRFFALEVKRPGKEPSLAQSGFLSSVIAAGGIGAVVVSVEEVQRLGL